MGNEDLGKHYQAIGELTKAFEAFARMRQDVSIPKHIVDVSKHLIEVGIEQRNWIAVLSNVQKIKTVQASSPEDISAQQYLAAAEGLATMDSEHYYNAAISFLSAETGMGASCNTIISPNDVAVYGGLCALASMGRNELQKKVLENSHFRAYLELEPHIRRAITFFVNSRYTNCLDILESYRADYLLDVHLHKHVENLYYLIRSKSIVQYFIPFSCVTLESLNAAFAPPGKSIEKELSMMILRNQLNARIDTQNKVGERDMIWTPHTNVDPAPHLGPISPALGDAIRGSQDSQEFRAGGPTTNPTHEHCCSRYRHQALEEGRPP
jgi:COP9 signalosome complex subunit 1